MAGEAVDGKYDTKIEVEFSNSVLGDLEHLGFTVEHLRHDDVRHVLFVDLVSVGHVDRSTRHRALNILREFEDRFGNTVTVEPAFGTTAYYAGV